ncbi:methyltransferase family protein [Kordiimonas sp.]|uniref:methyltransferase family protein n=1 Tax=Kordiimonas sp. TaxID=1970157 RepID=UPI003A90B8CC
MRYLGMIYGLTCYLAGVASLVLFILFANGHIGDLLPAYASLGIDAPNTAPYSAPVLINIALIALFGIQHSGMARRGFKAILTRVLPPALERSTYVLMTAVVILIMVEYWQPMPEHIWRVDNEMARSAINSVYYFGWVFSLAATYMINHFHLMGLQQSLQKSSNAQDKEFRTPMFYRFVRHPIQTGILIALPATPDMTEGRALLAAGIATYILVGLMFEERDLIKEFGDTYREYKTRVPGLLPWFTRKP